MATVRMNASTSTACRAARVNPSVLPLRNAATRRLVGSRVVVTRFKNDDVEADTTGAQHTGFHKGHQDLSNDKLTSTVAGTYEWQLFYLFLAGTVLFLPFIPGVTTISKALYEAVGGKLL